MPPSVEQRAERILELLRRESRVDVHSLAERLGVSLVTVRTDLAALEERGGVVRVRGGARLPDSPRTEGSFDLRMRTAVDAKRAIARAAAAMVSDGDAIAVDCSTTSYYIAEELRGRSDLVVVTNGLRAAALLAELPGTAVIMPGGMVRQASQSLVGDFGTALAERGRLRLGFFGLRGVNDQAGYLEISPEEAEMKRRLVSACDTVVGVFDSSKTDRFALTPFARLDEAHTAITDTGVAPELVESLRAAGQEVVLVDPGAEHATHTDRDGSSPRVLGGRS